MTAVQVGGRTSTSNAPTAARTARGASAGRILAELKKDSAERGTVYVGECDHLFLEPPKPLYAANGQLIGSDPGLFVDFGGVGMTRAYFPDKNRADREYCKRLDKAISDQHPDVDQFGIKRLEKKSPLPPATRWNSMSTDAIKSFVEANLYEDNHDANVAYVKSCALFETFRTDENGEKDVRQDVLKMLDGVLVSEAAMTNAFEAEIVLS